MQDHCRKDINSSELLCKIMVSDIQGRLIWLGINVRKGYEYEAAKRSEFSCFSESLSNLIFLNTL